MHESVLKKEVVEHLKPKPNDNFIDATIGDGGHSFEIIKRIQPNGKILGIDWDSEMMHRLNLKTKKEKLKNLILVNDNFKNLKEIVKKNCPEWQGKISGILFDLGFSFWHIEKSKRGFSFKEDEILDMRYDRKSKITAIDILNKWQEKEIERILREYGEERYSRKIAKKIIEQRKKKPILKTFELVGIIKRTVPFKKEKIHPATRTFQALRIAVNNELENLKKALPQTVEILKKGGRLVVISFHSLEDRIVKNFLKEKKESREVEILTKKPVIPTKEEIQKNPRARSAKLRAAKVI